MTSQHTAGDELREQLASIEHERWADWQQWCHKVLREANPSPEIGDILERWDRQIETPYSELSEKEKDSDREQVDRYWPLVQSYLDTKVLEARIDERETPETVNLDINSSKEYTDGFNDAINQVISTNERRIKELQAQKGEK